MVSNYLMLNYNSILEISLTFFGTILAIFFTLIALPLQNILGKYSQDLVNRVKRDKRLLFYFAFFILLFGYDFSLLILPELPIFILISFLCGLFSLVVLILLVIRIFHLLDIRNQINDISNNIQRQMDNKFKKTDIYGDTEWFENETEIIIDIIQKAIQENRFEIVDSGFKQIFIIVKKYINLNKTDLSQKSEDELLNYIRNSLINSKTIISINSHPKIISSYTKCSGGIAKETLKIKKDSDIQDDNIFSRKFVDLLGETILSDEISKETSNMHEIAGDQLVEIGKTAIDFEYPRVTEKICHILTEVNKKAIQIHSFRGERIFFYVTEKIHYLLDYSLKNIDKLGQSRKFILESMIMGIGSNIELYLIFSIENNIGMIEEEYSISAITHTLMIKIKDNYGGLDILEEIIDLLYYNFNQGVERNRGWIASWLNENMYSTGVGLIKLINELDDSNSIKKSKNILEKVFFQIYKAMENLFLKNSTLLESHRIYFSLIGIAFFENDKRILSEIIEKQVLNILNIHFRLKNNNGSRKTIFYQYIRLIGLWVYKWNENQELLDKIIEIIRIQDEFAIETETYNNLELESKYPKMFLVKQIEKPIFYENKDFELINKELFNDENKNEFEEYLKSKLN